MIGMAKVPGPKPRGSEITAVRVGKGMTRRTLADRAELAWVTVYNLECGFNPRTTWETLARIAKVLDVPTGQLVDREDVAA